MGLEVSLMRNHKKKEASRLLGLRGRHQYSHKRSSRISALCVAFTPAVIEGEESQMARSSPQRK